MTSSLLLGGGGVSSFVGINPKREQGLCVRYLSQNFPTAVALPSGRVGDDPGHLGGRAALVGSLSARLAGSLRRLTHAAFIYVLGSAEYPYFHQTSPPWRVIRMLLGKCVSELL